MAKGLHRLGRSYDVDLPQPALPTNATLVRGSMEKLSPCRTCFCRSLLDRGTVSVRIVATVSPSRPVLHPRVRKVDAVEHDRTLEAVRPKTVEGSLILWVRFLRIGARLSCYRGAGGEGTGPGATGA